MLNSKRSFRLSLIALVFNLLALGLSPASFSSVYAAVPTQPASAEQLVDLPGSVSNELGQVVAASSPALSAQSEANENIVLVLNPRNQSQLDTLTRDLKDAKSPNYHKHLTEAEFKQLYSPEEADVDSIKSYFVKSGLTVGYQSADRLLLLLSGKRSQLDKAFSTTSEFRSNKKGEQGLINVKPLKLPAEMAAKIKGVVGFDTMHRYKTTEQANFAPLTGANTPATLRSAYNIGATGQNGSGAKVAITLWGAPNQTDLNRWATSADGLALSLPSPLNLNVIGNSTPATDDSLRFEANMDVQLVLTAAPQSSVRFYVGASPLTSDMLTTISQAINDNVNVIVGSWGFCEAGVTGSTVSAYHTVFNSAAVKGIPVLFSSGDDGIFECQAANGGIGYAQFPAVDDQVTAVGGTSLTRDDTTNAWLGETAWSCSVTNGSNDSSCLKVNGGSSGGGISSNFARPSYQSITPPVEGKFTFTPPIAQRVIPDLSVDGDPNTGLTVYFNGTVSGATCADNCKSGGTSASSPLLAGMIAVAVQKNGGNQVGSLNPFIYANYSGAAWLNDVTAGYNGVTAKTGWDYTSGLGSLKDLNAFIKDFVAPTAPSNLAVVGALTSSSISLSWTDNSNNENGFTLERKSGTGNYFAIATLPANTTTYQDNGLTPGTAYYYQLKAYGLGGTSAYSNEVTATTSTVSPGTWTARQTPTTNQLNAIDCPHLNTCYAVGNAGTILASFDAGNTWTQQTSPVAANLRSIQCLQVNMCIAVGENGTVLITTDSGTTWTNRSVNSSYQLNSAFCRDQTNCFAVGFSTQSIILQSQDGGASWSPSLLNTSGTSNQPFVGVSCNTSYTCYALLSGGDLYRYYGNWTINYNWSGSIFSGLSCTGTNYSIPCFGAGSAGKVAWTAATGQPSVSTPTNQNLQRISCASECTAVGLNGAIVTSTTNPGDIYNPSWTTQNSGVSSNLYGVSCPDSGDCFAVGAGGLIITNGSSSQSNWSALPYSGPIWLKAINCLSESNCITVGYPDGGSPEYNMAITTNSGSLWTFKDLNNSGGQLLNIECARPATCITFGFGATITYLDNNGNWTASPTGPGPLGNNASCPAANICYTTADNAAVWKTVNGGQNWTRTASSPVPSNVYLSSISCPSQTTCWVASYNNNEAINRLYLTTDSGANWTLKYQLFQNYSIFRNISCPSVNKCIISMVPNQSITGEVPHLIKTEDGGSTWTTTTFGPNDFISKVKCYDSNNCFAIIGEKSYIYASVDGGNNWDLQNLGTVTTGQDIACGSTDKCFVVTDHGILTNAKPVEKGWNRQSSPTPQTLHEVSCPAPGSCFAVGDQKTVLATTNWGSNWTSQASAGGDTLNGISCPSTADCYVVGSTIMATTDGGTNWNTQSAGTSQLLNSISCPSSSSCIAVGAAGTVIKTTNSGSSWSPQTNANTASLEDIACPQANTCLAVGADGQIIKSTDGGNNWSDLTSQTSQNLWSISCPSANNCMVAGTTNIFVTVNGGTSWTAKASGTPNQLLKINCLSTNVCYAVGLDGTIVTTQNGGNTWTTENSNTTNRLEGLSCFGESICFAVGESGLILVNTTVLNVSGVTNATDNGQGTNPSTLSYALKNAKPGQTISLSGTINISGKLPPVPVGVTISGQCSATGPTTIIDGSQAPAGTIGLVVTGNDTLYGIKVTGFKGTLIKVSGTGNHLSCVVAKK